MPLPATKNNHALTETELDALQSEDSLLRGSMALELLNKELASNGIQIPREHVFRDYDRGVALKAINATFGLIGGVPAMTLWASQNPTEFYRLFAKQIPAEQNINGGASIQVVTNMPQSGMPQKVMDEQGFVQTVTAEVRPADVDDDDE